MIAWIFWHVVKPAHLRLRAAASKLVDGRLGVLTTDEVVARALGADIGEFRRLQRALSWSGGRRVVRRLRLGPQDVFLDIGCGAGRVACLVARSSISRVIGLDLDTRMVELATANAAGLRGRKSPIEIVHADATEFEVPDDVTWVYMHNPFGGEVMDAALRRMLASMDRRQRRMRLVYINPKEHEVVVGLGRFRPSASMALGWRPGREWARSQRVQFYEIEPVSAGRPVALG
jgi:SAM-dependent methyltransferase